jgi:hypothetical protein
MLHLDHKTRAALIAVLLCLAGNSFAQQAPGKWSGPLQTDKYGVMRVDATFKGESVALHFVGKSSCQVDASYIYTDANTSHYNIKASANGGGFCDSIFNGDLLAKPNGSGLILSIQKDKASWVANLASK